MTTAAAPSTGRRTRRRAERPPIAARRVGYLVAIGLNAAVLWLANVAPGWDALPFLTPETDLVMPFVNASLVAGVAANAVYMAADPRWLKALGDLVTTTVGIVAMVQIWQVFPFDFGDAAFDWALLVRWVLGIGIAGSAIGILVNLVSLVSLVSDTRSRT
jgi:hypothetical protein